MNCNQIKKNYTIIKDTKDLQDALNHIRVSEYLAYDTETTGLNVRCDRVIGFSFSGSHGVGFYFPIYEYDTNLRHLQKLPIATKNNISKILNMLKDKDLLMWNASFDIRITKNDLGVDLIDALSADIMLLKHSVMEEGEFSLKGVAKQFQKEIGLDIEAEANEEQILVKESIIKNGGSATKSNYELYKADLDIIGKYACADTDLTLRLGDLFFVLLQKEGLESFFFDDEVMPLYKDVTITMEERGVELDITLMEATKIEITQDLSQYKNKVVDSMLSNSKVKQWYIDQLNIKYPAKNKGVFAQELCKISNLNLQKTSSGTYSLTKNNIAKLPDSNVKSFLLTGDISYIENEVNITQIQHDLHLIKEDGIEINILSKKQLKEIAFDVLGYKSLTKTDKGQDQFDDKLIQNLEEQGVDWAIYLSDFNKMNKIKSTYIDRFLEIQEDGVFFPSFQQHRTISGRYGSDMQQLSRPKEEGQLRPTVLKYNNRIREFFIAGKGRKFIDNDYESLEPHVFAHVSGDEELRDIFRKGHDFYSTIAIKTEKLYEYSADKKADNYLGKLNKPKRQNAKAYCFTKDTLVTTEFGQVTIDQLKVGDRVLTREGLAKVERTFSRKSPVILVHTSKGTLECTADHQIYVKSKGWVEAVNLSKGDEVLHVPQLSPKEHPVHLDIMSNMSFSKGGTRPLGKLHLDPEWSYFIGALLGDGVISIKQTPSSHGHGLKGYVGICGDPADLVVEKVSSFMTDLGYPPRLHSKKGKCETMINTNSELCKVVYDTLGLGNLAAQKKCKNLKVPNYMFNASVDCKVAFIAGILDTDGYVKKIQNTSVACFTSKDHRLSTGIAVLLSSLGVETTYEPQYNKKYDRYYYTLHIPVASCVKLRQLGIQDYMAVPRKCDMFASVVVKQKRALKPARVVLIEDLKQVKEVFDIRVKDCHEFVANGIVVHNCLGVPYGMTGYALAKSLGISTEEGENLVKGYLDAFSSLKIWMKDSERQAKILGFVKTETGRIRHLPKVKEIYKRFGDDLLDHKKRRSYMKKYGDDEITEMYRDYKNGLNNAKNFQIQGLSASIVNRAAITITRRFKEEKIDGWVALQIHDQLVMNVSEKDAERASIIVQEIMENNYRISLALKAIPQISDNLKDGH